MAFHGARMVIQNLSEILLPALTTGIALVIAIANDPVLVDISGAADRTLCICS
jgi:hypothetical protein